MASIEIPRYCLKHQSYILIMGFYVFVFVFVSDAEQCLNYIAEQNIIKFLNPHVMYFISMWIKPQFGILPTSRKCLWMLEFELEDFLLGKENAICLLVLLIWIFTLELFLHLSSEIYILLFIAHYRCQSLKLIELYGEVFNNNLQSFQYLS